MESAALKKIGSNKSAPFERKLTECVMSYLIQVTILLSPLLCSLFRLYTISTWVDNLADADDFSISPNACLLCLREESLGGSGTDERVSISILATQIETGVVLWDGKNLQVELLFLMRAYILLYQSCRFYRWNNAI